MLTLQDFEGKMEDNYLSSFDILVEVAWVAKQKEATLLKETTFKKGVEADNYSRERLDFDKILKKSLELSKKRTLIPKKPLKSSRLTFCSDLPQIDEGLARRNPFAISIKENPLDMSMKEWLNNEEEAMEKPFTCPHVDGYVSKKERLLREKDLKKPAVRDSNKNEGKRCFESMSSEENTEHKPKKRKRNLNFGVNQRFPMPAELNNRIINMGGSAVKEVIQKSLFPTDIDKNEGRLAIPSNQVIEEFVTEEEETILNTRVGRHLMDIPALLIEPSLHESKISLKKWNIGKGNLSYVLVKEWNSVVDGYGLEANDVVKLWSFRVGLQLCFALVIVERHTQSEDVSSTSQGNKTTSKSQMHIKDDSN